MRVCLAGVVATLSALVAGCAISPGLAMELGLIRPGTTFAKHLRLADAGSVESQNLVGFMLFFGEGAPRNRVDALRWFRRAAEQGHAKAQLNLAVMYAVGVGVEPDRAEAERYFRLARDNRSGSEALSRPMLRGGVTEMVELVAAQAGQGRGPGEATYVTFCAGCHGLNGIAAFVDSPSFALGERLDENDATLARSILNGKGVMPRWRGKLREEELASLLAFVRSFPRQYEAGVAQALRAAPARFFLFGPMQNDRSAFRLRTEDNEDDIEKLLRQRGAKRLGAEGSGPD